MPHFTLMSGPHGPVIDAVVSVSEARGKALLAAGIVIPNPITIQVLIDTGASSTLLDLSVVQTLNLSPTGTTKIKTPSTGNIAASVDQYDVGWIIPPANPGEIPFAVGALPVICIKDFYTNQNVHGLLGRDVLSKCIFLYNGATGTFSLAF